MIASQLIYSIQDHMASNGIEAPSTILDDGKIYRFGQYCWSVTDSHLVPVLVGGAPGIQFEYEHSSLPAAFTECLLINGKFHELKNKARHISQIDTVGQREVAA